MYKKKSKNTKEGGFFEFFKTIFYAVFIAIIFRSLLFEPYNIPSGSMLPNLLIGDYLFVNKMKYGAKLPQTPISIPFVHNRIPYTFIPSFVDWFSSDYRRLLGYGEIKRNDIMVFNWPVGDSVIVHNGVIAHDYYAILRNQAPSVLECYALRIGPYKLRPHNHNCGLSLVHSTFQF